MPCTHPTKSGQALNCSAIIQTTCVTPNVGDRVMTVGIVMTVPNKFRLCAALMFKTVITISATLATCKPARIYLTDNAAFCFQFPFLFAEHYQPYKRRG